MVALCGLGQWLMEVGSSPESGIMMLAATAPIEMELVDGENILYRSGSYHLTGGGEIATLYIRDNMVLSIELDGVQLLTLRVSQKSVVTIGFQGYTTIQTLTAPDAARKAERFRLPHGGQQPQLRRAQCGARQRAPAFGGHQREWPQAGRF